MNNITLETANFSDQLGIYDFFNVLVSGATFVLGLCVINSEINAYLWDNIGVSKGLGMVILIYLMGVVLQELGSIWDRKWRKLYTGTNRTILKGRIIDDYTTVAENEIFENPLLLKQYRAYADKLLKKLVIIDDKRDLFANDYVSGFLFSVSQYYVAVNGKDKKVEKMRALYNMSKTLMIGFSLLTICTLCSFCNSIDVTVDFCNLLGLSVGGCECCINKALLAVSFGAMVILLYYRTKKIMKRFLLILLGTYDALMRLEAKDTKEPFRVKVNKKK